LETAWNAKAYSTYASTEMTTAFCECREQCGGHLIPELGTVEILDDAGSVLPDGEIGEVTITPFHIEGMPLLRYRTGDMSFLMNEPCACGRNSPRLGPIVGRKHQMIKCKGTSFYPSAIGNVLDGFDSVQEYQIRVSRKDLSDEVSVSLALTDESELAKIDNALAAALRVRVKLIVEPFDILQKIVFPPTSRKPVRLAIIVC
jgi:phenylacetate-CoA ligase